MQVPGIMIRTNGYSSNSQNCEPKTCGSGCGLKNKEPV